MPTVDIPNPTNTSVAKNGFGTGLPTPVLLAVVGGGIGLVVFLSRKAGSNPATQDGQGTLLPNTSIMLGSLQQLMLETEGKVTLGNADLSSQLSGVGENLGAQIDAQSAGISQSFADLGSSLNDSLGTIKGQETALASAIAGLGTQNSSLADSLTHVLQNLQTAESGINANQQGLAALSGGVAGIINNQNAQASLLTQLGAEINAPAPVQSFDWNMLNGKLLFSVPDQNYYTVAGGKVQTVSWWDTVQGKAFSNVPKISVNQSLSQYSVGLWQSPGG